MLPENVFAGPEIKMNPENNKELVRHIMEDGFNKKDLSENDIQAGHDGQKKGDIIYITCHRSDNR